MGHAAVRFGIGTASLLGAGWVLRALHGTPAALGAGPSDIAPVARRSPHYRDGVFENIDPASNLQLDREEQRRLLWEVVGSRGDSRPGVPIPVVTPTDIAPADLAVTWYGHSSALVEVDGYRVLTDPVWSRRCSPSRTVGPERLHDVPAPLEALPAIDAVVISHDHYDHLDIDTITGLARTQRAPFLVPLGVGAHLRKWGIAEDRIVELDWNESHRVGELTVTCTPARHFSGRLFTRNTTLWASWVVSGPRHRAFFGGDTGYTKSFAEIGADHGPFDVTLLPIGAYHPAWPDIHMNPEEAVRAHR
ncbi:MBL fold metallo-hydrolase, partial [Micromonospora sp. WMMD736]|uniref:MBL fold metallo-hydrolase n=1 Tax=Micromonospora sp. WMMD736 TaxID=3404112 RepID=UPI003B954BC0